MMRFASLLLVLVLSPGVSVIAPCLAQYGLAEDLAVNTYKSPSNRFSLRVDPGDRSGAGKASYVLNKDGKKIWSGEKLYTFWQAAVTDDGIVAGYAYSNGFNQADGDFIVAILGLEGEERMLEKTPREWSRFLHTPANPNAIDLFLDAHNDRMVVRIEDPDLNASSESWWTWRISDGKSTGKFKPRDFMADAETIRRAFDARPVAGTPLTLIHWYRNGCWQQECSDQLGARFTLVDAGYKPVWTLDFPRDYTNTANDKAEDRILDDMREHGAILDTSQFDRFDIRQVATQQRLSFAVERDVSNPGQWKVRKLGSTTHVHNKTSDSRQAQRQVPAVKLSKLGSIDLGNEQPENASPIRDLYDFSTGEVGRFAFTRGCNCNETEDHALIVVDDQGELVRKIELQPLPKEVRFADQLAWIRADHWLVTTSEFGERQRTSADWVDASTSEARHVENLIDAHIDALSASADGSFVALISRNMKYNIAHGLAAFDANGKLRWEIGDSSSDESQLFSPEDVAITSAGEIVVLENIRNKLKIYDQDGQWLRTVDLEEAWGRKPNYPSGIEPDAGGGVIIHDFQGVPPVVRMSLDGSVVDTLTPVFANGADFRFSGNVQSAPDGRLWTSDGAALLRLDKEGKVDKVVGQKPDAEHLGSIVALTVSRDRSVYAVDKRTYAVHVLDKQGQRERVLKPDLGDYSDTIFDPSLTVADNGDVYVARQTDGPNRLDFIKYTHDGKRSGVSSLSLGGEVTQDWYAQPGGSMRWVVGYENVYRVDAKGAVLNKLDRSADGQWLDKPSLASVGADGSIAVVSGGRPAKPFGSADSPPTLVTLFSAQGEILETWSAPEGLSHRTGAIAYDGQRLAFLVGKGGFEAATAVVVTDTHGAPLLRFTPHLDSPPGAAFLVSSEAGPELWLFDDKSRIERYALPAEAAAKRSE